MNFKTLKAFLLSSLRMHIVNKALIQYEDVVLLV